MVVTPTHFKTLPPLMKIEKIDGLLPQTQCQRCGFGGCRPYAEAIEAGDADINQCPPGGVEGVRRLARLLGVEPKPLDPSRGAPPPSAVAVIDESACIGCAQCLGPCPVDAIIGAPHQVHTVIAALCTGCELCIAPCPVDCIAMKVVPAPADESKWQRRRREKKAADASRKRHAFHLFRHEREERERAAMHARGAASAGGGRIADPRQAAVQAALERAKAKQHAASGDRRAPDPNAPVPAESE